MSDLMPSQAIILSAPLERRLWDLADYAEMKHHPVTAATLREAAEHVESDTVTVDGERWTAAEAHEEMVRLKAVLRCATEQAKAALEAETARHAEMVKAWEALGYLIPGSDFTITADEDDDADLAAVVNTLENELS